eukprot:SAG31_NODE_12710_length_922_cov_1.074119_1_plen_124_part_00
MRAARSNNRDAFSGDVDMMQNILVSFCAPGLFCHDSQGRAATNLAGSVRWTYMRSSSGDRGSWIGQTCLGFVGLGGSWEHGWEQRARAVACAGTKYVLNLVPQVQYKYSRVHVIDIYSSLTIR